MLLTPQNTLVTVAADGEWPHFQPILRAAGWLTVQTGVGKLNSALAVLRAFQKKPFENVVNLGSVGSNSPYFQVGDIVQISQILERDFQFSRGILTLPKLQTPALPDATLGTGDTFLEVGEHLPPHIQLVDMEGYAIARAAKEVGARCVLLKVVSDCCDGFSVWKDNIAPNSVKLAQFFVTQQFELA